MPDVPVECRNTQGGTLVSDQPAEAREDPVPNAALEAAMRERGFTVDKLARAADVDAKTVWRLKNGETLAPQQANGEALAKALRTTPEALWPDRFAPPAPRSPDSRTVTRWDERADIPNTVWSKHFASAHKHLDVLVYGGTFLFDSVPRFLPALRAAINAGVQVRVAVGDPHSHAVRQRGDAATRSRSDTASPAAANSPSPTSPPCGRPPGSMCGCTTPRCMRRCSASMTR